MSADTPDASPPAHVPAPRSRFRYSLSALLWSVAVCAVVVGFIVRSLEGGDTGMKNMVWLSTMGAALILVWAWFVFLSPASARTRKTVAGVTLAAVALAAGLLRFEGVSGNMIPKVAFRWTPEADQLLDAPVAEADLGAASEAVLATPTDHDYPQFLGPDRRATLTGLNLDADWKARSPKLLWKQPIGAGWSSFAIVGDYAVTQEQRGDRALTVCYAVRTGEVVWSHAEEGRFTSVLGGDGPRATPTVVDGKVYTYSPMGLLNCLDGATGEVIWSHNVLEETGGSTIQWGLASSPLVVDQKVIVPGGGAGQSVLAFDKETGEKIWAAGDDRASYASPVLATLYGVPQVLLVMQDWLVSRRLDDGEELFRVEWPGKSNSNASASQPVVVEGNRIFLSKGYGSGAMVVQVQRDEQGEFSTEVLWAKPSLLRTKLTNAVVRDGHAYGLSEGVLECVDLATGERAWKRGRYGHGQVVLIDDLLLVTSEAGEVALVEASPEQYRQLARFQALEGKTWNTPALSGNLLLIRNAEQAACYELPTRAAEE